MCPDSNTDLPYWRNFLAPDLWYVSCYNEFSVWALLSAKIRPIILDPAIQSAARTSVQSIFLFAHDAFMPTAAHYIMQLLIHAAGAGLLSLPRDVLELIAACVTAKEWAKNPCRTCRLLNSLQLPSKAMDVRCILPLKKVLSSWVHCSTLS